MRTIAVVTTSRADYSIYLPLLERIVSDVEFRLQLIVAGMHLSPEFGLTASFIEADGFEISSRVELLLSSDSPQGIAKSMGVGLIGFAQAYAELRPDVVMVLGDRFEMCAAALAAVPFKIPIAHLHGGELSLGAIDDSFRHAITKLSHLHFVATEEYARRVRQMGEAPWRVVVCGALALDNLRSMQYLTTPELEQQFDLDLRQPPLLVTFHPTTTEYEYVENQMQELLSALDACGLPIIFTLPNADTGGRILSRMIDSFVTTRPLTKVVTNFGTRGYFSMLRQARAMVGNSSSGLIEAAAFELPVVNVGNRQQGRVHGRNVVDVPSERQHILEAIERVTSAGFRERLRGMSNPYATGSEASRIVLDKLRVLLLTDGLLVKHFCDWAEVV